ncbi:MAG: hydrogenase formation protein HypD [Candidatus Hydrothermarchaeota archaeon]
MLDYYRDERISRLLIEKINDLSKEFDSVRIMHVCGTHEDTIARFGLRSLLPQNIEVVAGPGCPVCITPPEEIDVAIKLALEGNRIFVYGDLLRVPGSEMSLYNARGMGGDIRVVYSPLDALKQAKNSKEEVIFSAIGFETTAPSTASILMKNLPENFSIICSHRLIPPAIDFLLDTEEIKLDALIEPGHVSTIIGVEPYIPISEKYKIPQAITGFEPNDVLLSILKILKMLKEKDNSVFNEYKRSVRQKGNVRAKKMMEKVFDVESRRWRGFPVIPNASFKLKERYKKYDTLEKFDIEFQEAPHFYKECLCGEILRGNKKPHECKLFGERCTPVTPLGPCMVSVEGSCQVAYKYEVVS